MLTVQQTLETSWQVGVLTRSSPNTPCQTMHAPTDFAITDENIRQRLKSFIRLSHPTLILRHCASLMFGQSPKENKGKPHSFIISSLVAGRAGRVQQVRSSFSKPEDLPEKLNI